MEQRLKKQLFLSLLALIAAIPIAAAATGFGPLDGAIRLMSRVFYPSVILSNPSVRIGFFKFLYFLIIFATTNLILTKYVGPFKGDETGKRASAVVSIAFAAIASLFMPAPLSLTTSALITAIFALIIPLGIAIGIVYFAFAKLKDSWWEHLIGAMMILIALTIVNWTINFL